MNHQRLNCRTALADQDDATGQCSHRNPEYAGDLPHHRVEALNFETSRHQPLSQLRVKQYDPARTITIDLIDNLDERSIAKHDHSIAPGGHDCHISVNDVA